MPQYTLVICSTLFLHWMEFSDCQSDFPFLHRRLLISRISTWGYVEKFTQQLHSRCLAPLFAFCKTEPLFQRLFWHDRMIWHVKCQGFQADFNKWITSRYFSGPLWITDAEVASWGWKKYFRLPDNPAPNLFPKRYCQSISAPVHFCWGHAVGAYWQLGLSRPVCAAFELSLPNVSAWANISCANMTNTPTKLPEPGFSFVELPEPVFSLLWIQTTPRAEEICSCGAMTYQASTKHLCFEKNPHVKWGSSKVHHRKMPERKDSRWELASSGIEYALNKDEQWWGWGILKDLGLLRLGHFGNKSMESGIFQWVQ